jgi:hypothetical protein
MTTAPAATKAPARRRVRGGDAIYFDASKNCHIGAVSLGFGGDGSRVRRKVRGKTKAEVRQKLRTLHSDFEIGVTPPASYPVRAAVEEWLAHGLPGRSERTVQLYRDAVNALVDLIGGKQLRKLTPPMCGWRWVS